MSGTVGILLCAGGSTRMGFDKLLTPIAGKSAIERSLDALVRGGAERDCVRRFPRDAGVCRIARLPRAEPNRRGRGSTRAQSVKSALDAIDSADIVAIHDAARCMVSPETVRESILSAEANTAAAWSRAGSRTRSCSLAEHGVTTLDRSRLIRMQTPQTFRFRAHQARLRHGRSLRRHGRLRALYRGGLRAAVCLHRWRSGKPEAHHGRGLAARARALCALRHGL